MTEINRSGLGSAYTEIIKKDSNKAKESNILDKKTDTDNVIDLTDKSNLISELGQSKAEFIKVSDDTYLKLDLSNPNAVKELLSDLKSNILSEDGQKVLEGFNYVSFSEETGISIQNIAQAKRLTVTPKQEEKPVEKVETPKIDEQKIFEEINNIKDEITTTSPKEIEKLKELQNQLKDKLLTLASPEMRDDVKKLLDMPKDGKLNKQQTQDLTSIISKYKDSNKLKDLMSNFDLISPDNTLRDLTEKIPDQKIKDSTLKTIIETRNEILPSGVTAVALPVKKESFDAKDAVAELDKLAEQHPEVKELLDKLEASKGTGKSLKLMGITKEDLALYLTTGQVSPKMQETIKKAYSTGNWPAVNSVIEITRLNRLALQDQVKSSQSKINDLYKSLSTTSNPEEQKKIKENIFKLTSEMDELEVRLEEDNNTLRTLPDTATRARTAVSQRAIGIFDAKLAKLSPDSPEYAKIKQQRDQEMVSLRNDASALDTRIEKAESKGKKPSSDLKGLAVNVHTTTATSDISMFGIESAQKANKPPSSDPLSPPPKSESLVDAEKHVKKVEEYTPNASGSLAVQDLKLSLHQAQRQDAKDRLKATGAVYDEKSRTFKYPIPANYQPTNESAMPSDANYSAPQDLSSSTDKTTSVIVTEAQKDVEKDYHVAGIQTLKTIDTEKKILKSELPDRFAPAPTDPTEAKRQQEVVNKLASLEAKATDIKIEQNNVLIAEQKANKELTGSDKALTAKQERYLQISKQKDSVSVQLRAVTEQLGELQAEIDDWKDNYVFDNPKKQEELETAKKKGQSALELLQKEHDRLRDEERALIPEYTTDEKTVGSIAGATESYRVASGRQQITSVQSQALQEAYASVKDSGVKQVNSEAFLERAKSGIQEGERVFDTAPEWMKGTPEFKASKAHHLYTSTLKQRTELAESVQFVAEEKEAKAQPSLPKTATKEEISTAEQKGNKASSEAGLSAKQTWDTETVAKLEDAERIRVSLKDSKDLSKETKEGLAIESIGSQVTVAKGVSNTIPNESLRMLGRSYEMAEFEVSPDTPNADGTHPIQTDLLTNIGQTALDCVGTSFKRELIFKGQKAITEGDLSAPQNLLNLSSMVADTLVQKTGGLEASNKIKEGKEKWDSAIKDVGKQIEDHKGKLRAEKSLVLDAFDYQMYRTKESASGHFLAAEMWKFRDQLEADDPQAWQALAIMTVTMPGVHELATMKAAAVTAGFREPDTSDPNFNYDKIDLQVLDKLRSGLESRYDSQIEQLDVVQKGLSGSVNTGLTYLSALKLYSESLEDNTTDVKLPQSLAKGVLGKSGINAEALVNPKSSQWDPTLKSWAGKGALSDQGAGFTEEAKTLEAQTGSLLAGGYQKELSDAKQMEARYAGMSVTDVLGVDTTGWEIKDENFTWLNKVGSVLNKTDTVALIAEIAVTEALTAGLGSALATARVARFLEQVAVNYPKVEKAIALARAVSSFAPSVISGEKNAVRALELIGQVAKGEGAAVRMFSGMRRLEEAGQIGVRASRLQTAVNGSVHMGQAMAVQGGLGLVAERLSKDHPLAAKMLEFSGQFIFTSSANKFSGIKDFSGRLAMNLATMYGQQASGQLISYGLEKALEASNNGPLTADQKLEVKKWSERLSMITGIVVPSISGAFHGQQLTPEKINELSLFHTETVNSGLAKGSPEYQKLQSGFGEYLKVSNDAFATPEQSRKSLKSLQEMAEKLPPQAKENLTSFIKEESIKLSLKEMPKSDTNDPSVHAQHVEKYLTELNGKDGLPKYDSQTIKTIVEQQRLGKTIEGIQKIEPNIEELGKPDSKEAELLSKVVEKRKEELTEKLKEVKSLSPEDVKEIVDTSLKMSLEQLASQKGINKEALFAIAKASEKINTPLVIKVRPEEGLPAQEFSIKYSKTADNKEFLELSREGYEPIKLSREDISKMSSNGDHIDFTLREGLKLQKVVETPAPNTTPETVVTPETPQTVVTGTAPESKPIEFKPVDTEVSKLFNDKPLKTKEDVVKFMESKKAEVEKFLTDNIGSGNTDKIIDFYKMMGGWDNVRNLEGKIDSNLFNKIHESRDTVVKSLWAEVNKEAEAKGLKLEDGFVGTPPTDPLYKRAWSDVDFSVKIKSPKDGASEAEIKKFGEMSDVDKHIVELELMQSMQRKLQETFDGAPSHTVDSNAYATPLIMDVGKGKPVSDSLRKLDAGNQKEMDFYQIRLGFGTSKSGTASYNRFKKETIRAAKVKAENLAKKGKVEEANKLLTDVENGFKKAEENISKFKSDLKAESKELKAKYPDKSEKAIEEMALTELRFKKENDLIQFMKDNREILASDSVEGQAKRVEFNQKAREMRALWPEAYIGDQAAKWGSSGSSAKMSETKSKMTNAEKMQARVSQDQFKLHWLVEVRNEKELSARLLKASKYELRDIGFKKDQMESVTGSSHTVTGIESNPAFDKEKLTNIDTVKAYTSEEFPDHAAFQEIKEYAKSPADAEKIWIKHFGKEPNPKETASRELEDYLSLMESVTTVNLFNHILQPEIK